jgi:hypothetical protein
MTNLTLEPSVPRAESPAFLALIAEAGYWFLATRRGRSAAKLHRLCKIGEEASVAEKLSQLIDRRGLKGCPGVVAVPASWCLTVSETAPGPTLDFSPPNHVETDAASAQLDAETRDAPRRQRCIRVNVNPMKVDALVKAVETLGICVLQVVPAGVLAFDAIRVLLRLPSRSAVRWVHGDSSAIFVLDGDRLVHWWEPLTTPEALSLCMSVLDAGALPVRIIEEDRLARIADQACLVADGRADESVRVNGRGRGVRSVLWRIRRPVAAVSLAIALLGGVVGLDRYRQLSAVSERRQALELSVKQALEAIAPGRADATIESVVKEATAQSTSGRVAGQPGAMQVLAIIARSAEGENKSLWIERIDVDASGAVLIEGQARTHADGSRFAAALRTSGLLIDAPVTTAQAEGVAFKVMRARQGNSSDRRRP